MENYVYEVAKTTYIRISEAMREPIDEERIYVETDPSVFYSNIDQAKEHVKYIANKDGLTVTRRGKRANSEQVIAREKWRTYRKETYVIEVTIITHELRPIFIRP